MYKIFAALCRGAPEHTWLTNRVEAERRAHSKETRQRRNGKETASENFCVKRRYRDTIVEASLFDRVQQRLETTPRPGSRRLREYPLTAALRCASCGRRMHGNARGGNTTWKTAAGEIRRIKSERLRYYACHVCNYSLNAERLEQQFFAEIGRLAADENLLRRWVTAPSRSLTDQANLKREHKRITQEISEGNLQRNLDRVFDLGLRMEVGENELRRQMGRVRTEFAQRRCRLEEIEAAINSNSERHRSLKLARDLLKRFSMTYQRASYEVKREIVGALTDALGGVQASRDGMHWARGASPPLQDRRTRVGA